MKTRKQLLAEIERLESELYQEKCKQEKTAFIDNAGLPPCESMACIRCKYFVYYQTPGRFYPLGCGRNVSCKDFKPHPAPPEEILKEVMEEELRYGPKEGLDGFTKRRN